MRPALLLSILLIVGGCVATSEAPSKDSLPRIEARREVRRMQTLDLQGGDLRSSDTAIQEAPVLDIFIHDRGATEVRHAVVSKLFPQILAALEESDADGKTLLVRLLVVPGDDPHQAWLANLQPRQIRALTRMAETDRTRMLERIPWGYTERRKL